MELDPTSENGKRLNQLLNSWLSKASDLPIDVLTRVFLMYAMKIENHENFLDALYGQRVLQEPHWDLTQERPTAMSRVRHAIGTSVRSRRVKELVVALEWSNNHTVLTDILKWAEDTGMKEITEHLSAVSPMDLAPQRAAKTFSSMLLLSQTGTALSQRERELNLHGKIGQRYGSCRNCNKIIIGLDNGQIKIYDSAELQCEAVLPYYNEKSELCSFQCTCSEIIAGYDDGNICAWDIKSGDLKHKVSVVKLRGSKDFPKRMRWQSPNKLAVATSDHRIQIWQYVNSSFTLLGGWSVTEMSVRHIEFDENHVILHDLCSLSIHVYFPNGKLLRRIQSPGNTNTMAYQTGMLITGGEDKTLRIWDVETGACVQQLEGHADKIVCIEMKKNLLLSGDYSGAIIVWDISATTTKIADRQSSSALSVALPASRKLVVNLNDDDRHYFVFGTGFVLVPNKKWHKFRVIDFP